MTILLTGGTGFVGPELVREFSGSEIYLTTRNPMKATSRFGDLISGVIPWESVYRELVFDENVPNWDVVINLMGEPISEGRWTAAKKKRIRDSRVLGTRRLVAGLLAQSQLPEVFVSASAVGIYGDHREMELDETCGAGSGFLADVCREWESATEPLVEAGVRVVLLRIGIVLGKGGGAIKSMAPIFRWGVGGRLGNGRQYVPWIHLRDLVRMICWSVQSEHVQGVLNAVAPNPVTNAELTRSLARAIGRPAWLPVPGFALRWVLGGFADCLLGSQRAVPVAALDRGFEFTFSDIDEALRDILGK